MKKIFVCISIVIIAIALIGYRFVSYKNEQKIIQKENLEFDKYKDQEINGVDVASLINLAQNSEKNSKFNVKVEITLNGNPISKTSNEWLEENGSTDNKYKCKSIHVNTDTLLVDKVEILSK